MTIKFLRSVLITFNGDFIAGAPAVVTRKRTEAGETLEVVNIFKTKTDHCFMLGNTETADRYIRVPADSYTVLD